MCQFTIRFDTKGVKVFAETGFVTKFKPTSQTTGRNGITFAFLFKLHYTYFRYNLIDGFLIDKIIYDNGPAQQTNNEPSST